MRKEFATWMEAQGAAHSDIIFVTGDLGFQALEKLQAILGPRFVNAGVSEQNLVSMAAGMAQQGLRPFCYSIAPFIVFRPAENIRLDVCLHNLNVKLIGNGGGYGYGIMGATHHAIEDLAMLSAFQNLRCYIPYSNQDVAKVCDAMQAYTGPAYLRLGFGQAPEGIAAEQPYAPVRRLATGSDCTIVGIGPVINLAIAACRAQPIQADVFAVSELPVSDWGGALEQSLAATRKVLIVEEHVQRGGLGEHLAAWMAARGLAAKWAHRFAVGYPNKRYGSQAYHQHCSGLDTPALQIALQELLHG